MPASCLAPAREGGASSCTLEPLDLVEGSRREGPEVREGGCWYVDIHEMAGNHPVTRDYSSDLFLLDNQRQKNWGSTSNSKAFTSFVALAAMAASPALLCFENVPPCF